MSLWEGRKSESELCLCLCERGWLRVDVNGKNDSVCLCGHTFFKDFSVQRLHAVLRSLLASASGGCGCTVLAHSFHGTLERAPLSLGGHRPNASLK